MLSGVHQHIEQSLKAILPYAQQADEILEELKRDNKAKFSAIFPQGSPFKTQATRFLPYLEELDIDLKALPDVQDAAFEPLVTDLVKKIELMQLVLGRFHEAGDVDIETEEDQH